MIQGHCSHCIHRTQPVPLRPVAEHGHGRHCSAAVPRVMRKAYPRSPGWCMQSLPDALSVDRSYRARGHRAVRYTDPDTHMIALACTPPTMPITSIAEGPTPGYPLPVQAPSQCSHERAHRADPCAYAARLSYPRCAGVLCVPVHPPHRDRNPQ